MGADFSQALTEVRILWLQAAFYFAAACLVYQYQFHLAKRYAKID